MRVACNTTAALQLTIDTFIPSSRARIAPFRWSTQHAQRSQRRFNHQSDKVREKRLAEALFSRCYATYRSSPERLVRKAASPGTDSETAISSVSDEVARWSPDATVSEELDEQLAKGAEGVESTEMSPPTNVSGGTAESNSSERELAQSLGWLDGDVQTIRDAWAAQYQQSSDEQPWVRAMLWLFEVHPERAMVVVDNTIRRSQVEPVTLWEVMGHFAESQLRHHPRFTDVAFPELVDLFLERFNKADCLNVRKGKLLRVIHLLLKHSDTLAAIRLHDAVRSQEWMLTVAGDLMLRFSRTFIRHGDLLRAMECLEDSRRQRVEATWTATEAFSKRFHWLCHMILKRSMQNPHGQPSHKFLLSRMADMGLQLDTFISNVMLRDALEAKDFETALKIVDQLEQKDSRMNPHLCAMLLQAVREHPDSTVVEKVLKSAAKCEFDRWAATEFILCLYNLLNRNNTPEIYSFVRQVYLKYFGYTELKELGIWAPKLGPTYNNSVFRPSSAILTIMLIIFLKHHGTEHNVVEIYNNFRAGVAKGGRLLRLTSDDYTYNAFLYAAAQWPGTLRFCAKILRDMSTPLPSQLASEVARRYSNSSTNTEPAKNVTPAQPTVRTWNILVHAFARHNQPAAAEKVVDLMQQRGLKPDIVTWTSLLNAHANVQDFEGITSTFRRKEEAGVANDDKVWTAFRNLKDRAAFTRYMSQQVQEELRKAAAQEDAALGTEPQKEEAVASSVKDEDWFEDYEVDERYMPKQTTAEDELSELPHELYMPTFR